MRLNAAPHICVVKKEEKEAKLRDFILRDLAARQAGQIIAGYSSYLLLARSIDSPVARALFSVCRESACAGVRLKTIFMMDEGSAEKLEDICGEFAPAIDGRLVSDVRLLDAHELLVLGPATAWIGDCMRRDPAKRDAYEFYSEDSPEAARTSARSFDRLWLNATPLVLQRLSGLMAAEAAKQGAAGSSIEAATRH